MLIFVEEVALIELNGRKEENRLKISAKDLITDCTRDLLDKNKRQKRFHGIKSKVYFIFRVIIG